MKTFNRRLKWLVTPLLAALLLLCVSGCTTPSQTFALSSTPSGARVTVNGGFRAYTPVSMSLEWKQEYHVALALDGYEPYSFEIKPRMGTTAWVINETLNTGGLTGLSGAIVSYTLDAATGVFTPLQTKQPQASKGVINVLLKPIPKTTESPRSQVESTGPAQRQ